jgi:hypothetical protein
MLVADIEARRGKKMSSISWVKRCASGAVIWFREGRIGWLALVIGLLLLIGFHWLPLGIERRLAMEGMTFQLIGVGVSAFVIGRLRRYFKLDPILKSFFKYLAGFRYVFIARPPSNLTAAAMTGLSALVGTAVVYAPPTGTLEERLARVETQVRDLHLFVDAVRNLTSEVERKLTAAIKQETSARDAEFVKIDDKLKETLVGDWQFAFVGLVYLFVGIILGTVPEEIARLMLYLGLS